MLLTEQLRNLQNEKEFFDSGTDNYQGVNVHDWTTQLTKTVNEAIDKIACINWNTYTTPTISGASRILVDDVPLASSGYLDYDESVARTAMVYLSAGSHTIKFQTAGWDGSGSVVIDNVKIGLFDFLDKSDDTMDSGNVVCTQHAVTTVLSDSFSIPASRNLAIGSIKKYTAIVEVFALNTTDRTNIILKDKYENLVEDAVNFYMYTNGIKEPFVVANQDFGAKTTNPSYGIGAYARLAMAFDPGTTPTLKIDVYNHISTDRTCRCYVKITICPWIIPESQYEPLTLDFAQGSTLYVIVEPLTANPTKNVKVGKIRGISGFGDAAEFYKTVTGADILSFDYTFEVVEVDQCSLYVDGYEGCVSVIGVDVR